MTQTDRADATDSAPGLPPAYRLYDIDATLYDASGQVVEEWQDVQEIWLEPPSIAVRRTRKLADGGEIVYEDRGQLTPDFRFEGRDGFGGTWAGRPFPQEGIIYTEGDGPKASFTMTNWSDSQTEEHCLRVLTVHEPLRFLADRTLEPGRYYVRTRDHVRSASDQVPASMKQPLGG